MHGCADQFRAETLDSVLEIEGLGRSEIGGRQAISNSRKTWREGDQGPAGLEEPIAHLSRAPQNAVDGRRREHGLPVGRSPALRELQIRRARTAQRWRALSNETASAHQEQDDTGIPPCFTANGSGNGNWRAAPEKLPRFLVAHRNVSTTRTSAAAGAA